MADYHNNRAKEIQKVVELQTGTMRCEAEQVTGDAIHRFYKATPKNIWMNDDEKDADGNYVKDVRVEVTL